MKLLPCLAFLALTLATSLRSPATAADAISPVDQYNVVWASPSADHHGSMPLGNGDIALNAWMTSQGDLQFYIAKTDAWDDNARLVKVGMLRVHLSPNPISPGRVFRQELKLAHSCVEITVADSPGPAAAPLTTLRLWVDANHPVIHVTADGSLPFEATASIELWRTNRQELVEVQCSDVMNEPGKPASKHAPTILEPDTLLTGQTGRIGWYHQNTKSVGPAMLAAVQGLTGFTQEDPLLGRTFGGMITARGGQRLDDTHLRSPRGTSHQFSITVLTVHPATPERWLASMDTAMRGIEAIPFETRRAAHEAWWREFWERSWIRAAANRPSSTTNPLAPPNQHPIHLGADQSGGTRFTGEIGRFILFSNALSEAHIASLAAAPAAARRPSLTNPAPYTLPGSEGWNPSSGFTLEVWVRPSHSGAGGGRLVDKITPGGSDGFLLDTHPGDSLRFICGATTLSVPHALAPDQWTHVAAVADPATRVCRLYVNGRLAAEAPAGGAPEDPAQVSQMYQLQRYVTACAGRGAYPIKFNGSLFTVPPGPDESDPDYRRWGPGYWWQNTRLPYISLNASGDYDLQRPLFRMYAEQLLPLARHRTKLYLGHDGAYYPECIMFWGAVFSETYGWTPFADRADKLQESGWHKWEWVGGLELCWMMLDYYDHTLDHAFLARTALPFTREILTFFDQHYPVGADGKLVMHPSQALETWWRCTNAAPELAGCLAVTERLLALPGESLPPEDRILATRLHSRLPAIPLRSINGREALAPAATFANKSNIENPELYSVFPFRLFAFNRPHADWAVAALENRWDRGHSGWRQDDIFMAYLGLSQDAAAGVLSRAASHDNRERFPAFFGPNYDWTPDQDHGGVLMKAFQAMLLQTDGAKIFLLPAWPKNWDADFKLHAPGRTVIEGGYHGGKLTALSVTPKGRQADLVLPAGLSLPE